MSSPAHDAPDLEVLFNNVYAGIGAPHAALSKTKKTAHQSLATVRERLDTLTAERDKLQGRVYALENVFPEDVRAELDTLTAQVEQLTQERGTLAEQGRVAAKRYSEEAQRRMEAEAENARLTALLETTREGLRHLSEGRDADGNLLREQGVRRYARALLAASSPAPGDTECGACGKRPAEYRGWTDEGSPMPTCAECGAPGDTEGGQA